MPSPRPLRATISLTKSAPNIRSSADPLAVDGETTGSGSLPLLPAPPLPGGGSFKRSLGGDFHTITDTESDALYVGDNNDFLHKFAGVFNGTPREVTTGGWPVKVGNVPIVMSSPAFDSGSNNIFFSDALGNLKYIKEVGSVTGVCCSGGGAEPCNGTVDGTAGGPTFIELRGAVVDGPLVDTTTGTVFFFSGPANAGSNVCDSQTGFTSPCFGLVEQTNTQLGNPVKANVGGSIDSGGTVTNIHAGFFDNNYLNGNLATGFLYVCGKNRGANGGANSRTGRSSGQGQ